MILVTIGTHLPFDRLLRAVDPLAESERVVVQCGDGAFRPSGAECVGFLSFAEFEAHVREARLVITHAGVGSVVTCLRNSRRPIVVARRASFGEAADDHQVAFARRLDAIGLGTVVEDLTELPQVVAEHDGSSVSVRAEPALVNDLRGFIASSVARR